LAPAKKVARRLNKSTLTRAKGKVVDELPIRVRNNGIFFRDLLRNARNQASAVAEDFPALLHAFERLGCTLCGRIDSLGGYAGSLISLASRSPLARAIPKRHRDWHLPVPELVDTVRKARNDALHQGAYARHLTAAAIQLAIVLEDGLMNGAKHVGDLMVRNPVCACPWQPISFIRQEMLAHSFSFLPVHFPGDRGWKLVSDLAVAKYLRSQSEKRDERLATRLEDAVSEERPEDNLELCPALRFCSDDPIGLVLSKIQNVPVLVYLGQNSEDLVGILTAFDLL
jgi:CBS domain-containing protein